MFERFGDDSSERNLRALEEAGVHGTGDSPFAELDKHLKLDVVDEERFRSGALAQTLVPKR